MLTCLEGKVYVDFIDLTKEEILKYDFQQLNKKVIFNWKIISHVKKEPEQKKKGTAVLQLLQSTASAVN